MFVNGINVDTDTLDVFQLFETVRSEIQLASSFYEMGFRREYLSVLYSQNFGSDSSSYAVDFREAYPEVINFLTIITLNLECRKVGKKARKT